MPLWIDMLRTPMAAPETRALRRLRRIWQMLCIATALVVMLQSRFAPALGRLTPLWAAILIATTIACTVIYGVRKKRADDAFIDASLTDTSGGDGS